MTTTTINPDAQSELWQRFADATLDHDRPAAVTAEQRILQLLAAVQS